MVTAQSHGELRAGRGEAWCGDQGAGRGGGRGKGWGRGGEEGAEEEGRRAPGKLREMWKLREEEGDRPNLQPVRRSQPFPFRELKPNIVALFGRTEP